MTTNNNHYTNLESLVAELDRQRKTKVDFVCDVRNLGVGQSDADGTRRLYPNTTQMNEFLPKEGVALPTKTLKQLSEKLAVPVPAQFIEKMDAAGHVIPVNDLFNYLINETPKSMLVRCLDGRVRAMLSDRYRILDSFDIAFGALQAAREAEGEVLDCWITEDNMSISFTTRQLWDRFNEGEKKAGKGSHYFDHLQPKGDDGDSLFQPLITIKNSETGRGGLSVRYGILRARCVNKAIIEDARVERHIGAKIEAGILSTETLKEEMKVTMMKVRDAIVAGFTPAIFDRLVSQAKDATKVTVSAPQAAISSLTHELLSEEAQSSILEYFLSDYDKTAYGLSQAVARYAQDVPADKGDELQALAGAILSEPKRYALSA